MSGPTVVIELAAPIAPPALRDFRALMMRLASRYDERRPGFFDVTIPAQRLGAEDRRTPVPLPGDARAELTPMARRADRHRPFLVYLMGPDAGDESTFDAEHADEPDVEAVLGFRPTHAVNVSACCDRGIDHVATALLTAAVIDVVGGVAKAELLDGQASVVANLPGLVGIADDDYPMALGTARFLRSWAAHPAFRLVK